jgi:hypothetical protein
MSYQPEQWCDRITTVGAIVALFQDLGLNQRSVLVEGPAQSGKSWLIHRVAERLGEDRDIVTRVCIIHSTDVALHGPFAWVKLIERLWEAVQELVPSSLHPDLALTLGADSEEQVRQWVAAIAAALIEAQQQAVFVLVLAVDGLDEFTPETLDQLEEIVIVPLYRCKRVRLLSTRRMESSPFWSSYELKHPTITASDDKYRYKLDDFDDIEDQIAKLSTTYQFQAGWLKTQLSEQFSWRNPGVNTFLARWAGLNRGVVSADIIELCIKYLLLPGNDVRQLMNLDNDNFRARVEALVDMQKFTRIDVVFQKTHHEIASDRGIARSRMLGALPSSTRPREHEAFLNDLEDRGVGFRVGVNFRVYPIYVELFRELWSMRSA